MIRPQSPAYGFPTPFHAPRRAWHRAGTVLLAALTSALLLGSVVIGMTTPSGAAAVPTMAVATAHA